MIKKMYQSQMARSMSHTLIRVSSYPIAPSNLLLTPKSATTLKNPHLPCRLLAQRHHSSHSDTSQSVVDLNHADSSDADIPEALAVQKIEDAIYRIVVRRLAPDWLPFLPGSSYWVPPRRTSYGIAQIVHNLANSLTDEEAMSLATVRGWPSSAFYLHDMSSKLAEPEVETSSAEWSQAEDKEG